MITRETTFSNSFWMVIKLKYSFLAKDPPFKQENINYYFIFIYVLFPQALVRLPSICQVYELNWFLKVRQISFNLIKELNFFFNMTASYESQKSCELLRLTEKYIYKAFKCLIKQFESILYTVNPITNHQVRAFRLKYQKLLSRVESSHRSATP